MKIFGADGRKWLAGTFFVVSGRKMSQRHSGYQRQRDDTETPSWVTGSRGPVPTSERSSAHSGIQLMVQRRGSHKFCETKAVHRHRNDTTTSCRELPFHTLEWMASARIHLMALAANWPVNLSLTLLSPSRSS